jgi:hypothetical protein
MELMPDVYLNSLAPTTDINTVIEFVNNHGAGVINPEVFYSKQLLDTIRLDADAYTYYRYAEAAPIQERADKLTMRRWAPLRAHTTPLAEGVPPKSDKGSVEKYEIQAYQYGRYMEFTDKVDFQAVDPIVAHYSQEYAIVAIETLDLLAQKELLRVAQKFFAGLAKNVSEMTIASGKPSIGDLRLIGLSLKKQLVKPRSNGRFHVIVSPEFVYDMLDDEYVQNYMKINQTTEQMYENGTLIPMFGFEFYEVMNCPDSGVYVNSNGKKVLPIYKQFETGDKLGNKTYSADDADELGYIYGTVVESSTTYSTADGYENDSRTGEAASYIPGQVTWVIPQGWKELKIQHTLILGKDALVRTGLSGEDNAKMYVKPLGSAGVLDPIDQRQSIGFKINSVGFGSTRLEAVVDYMNIPSQLNV